MVFQTLKQAVNSPRVVKHPLVMAIAGTRVKHRFDERLRTELAPGARVLDAGAGEAVYRVLLEQCDYVAMDTTVGDENWNYSAVDVVGSVEDIPLVDGSFDAVLSIQVLEHVAKPQLAMREMFRVLKPGGRLYLTAPQSWQQHQKPYDYYRYTSFGLRYLLEEAGFGEIEIEPLCGYFVFVAQQLKALPSYFARLPLYWRLPLLPIEVLAISLFRIAVPLLGAALDPIDRSRDATIGYVCTARKPV